MLRYIVSQALATSKESVPGRFRELATVEYKKRGFVAPAGTVGKLRVASSTKTIGVMDPMKAKELFRVKEAHGVGFVAKRKDTHFVLVGAGPVRHSEISLIMALDAISLLWCHGPHESQRTFPSQGGPWRWICRNCDLASARTSSTSEQPYKYRLVYVIDGKRVVGYDNERGKGDHKHLGDREEAYCFANPRQLMADFMADVKGAE